MQEIATVRSIVTSTRMTSVLLMLLVAGCGSGGGGETEENTTPVQSSGDLDASFFAPSSVVVGQAFMVVANGDVNSEDVSFDWSVSQAPSGSQSSVTARGAAARITTDLTGTYVVSLTVTDSSGQSGVASRSVSGVTETSSGPDASFFAPEFVTSGEPFDVSANVVAPGLTYDWAITQSPALADPEIIPNGPDAQVVADRPGEYAISLMVTSPEGQSDADSRTVTVLSPTSGTVITGIELNSTASGSSTATNVPVTFGQVFAPGDVPAGLSVEARLENGDAAPLQVDVKSRYPDGSLKHAVLSSVVPSLQGGQQLRLEILSCDDHQQFSPVELSDLPAEYDATATINLGGNIYTASLRQSMLGSAPSYWLQGFVATEAHYQIPFRDASGAAHPLLSARFQLRVYETGDARTDIIVENASAFGANASNLNYTVNIVAGGAEILPSKQVNHHHHSRWRRIAWLGGEPQLHLEYDVDYVISTGTVPNYDRSISLSPSHLAGLETSWNNNSDIMDSGLALKNMPAPGGRMDLGLLPGWTSMYLYSMTEGAAAATYGTADAAAHWPIHYRDADTGLPVSLEDYPNLTTHANVFDSPSNPLPPCNNCGTTMNPDTAHQPSLVFVPYLLTGDHYYLEELHFWTNWNSFPVAPQGRDFGQAVYRAQQARAQAWSMRTLLQAVFITPDNHPLKGYFQTQLDNNFQFYMNEYVNNPSANKLGWIISGWTNPAHATVLLSPWEDDFFTMIMNYARHLGFAEVQPILDWKMQFSRKRMTDPVFCWQFATTYRFVASQPLPGPMFDNIADAYIPTLQFNFGGQWQAISQNECGTAAMANAAGFSGAGEFAGYPNHPVGYPAALRPVLAAAVERNEDWAQLAWDRLTNAPRQPDFAQHPSFAISPR
ncbi:MAG: PKD domain-containing protein [Gammaproteobacteria bacterium]|nr:PKD domain-containing protein [Gammaproteobacteria bacterium]